MTRIKHGEIPGYQYLSSMIKAQSAFGQIITTAKQSDHAKADHSKAKRKGVAPRDGLCR